ncbi:MAG TPA: CARDB domain-containing protein, partial [Myxococcales bacterium]|nr:CARDB domain-containing protein [Myxococcales bacterium]
GSVCLSDGSCSIPPSQVVASQCQNVSCPANFFCANGKCLPAVAQCKSADPTCIFVPHGAFEPPVHQWWWPFTSPLGPDDPANGIRADLDYPDFVEVMSTPVVMRLHASDPEPAIVFNAFTVDQGGAVESRGLMRAIRGSDASHIWTAPKDFWNAVNIIGAVDGNSSIAAGDCKGDGHVCFVTGGWNPDDVDKVHTELSHRHGGLIAFDENGDFLWLNRGNPQIGEAAASVWWGGPAMARLLPDSPGAQIVVGNGVYDAATGKTMCAPTAGQSTGNGIGALSAIADVDLDGVPEIITGNNAYKLEKDPQSPTGYRCRALYGDGVRISNKPPNCPYGSVKSISTGQQVCVCPGGFEDVCPDGFPAIASFAGYGLSTMGVRPDDKHPQIVVVSRGFLRIHDWTGGMLLNPVPIPVSTNPDCSHEGNAGGAPTIADFDGDGLPEVGVAAQGSYVVWKPGKGFIWQSPTFDCSSATGSSVFDFEGKGSASVVYSDQCYFRVYDGKTGATLVQEKNTSCTAYETPIVADIDGTGRAKVLVPNNNVCLYSCNWDTGTEQISNTPNIGIKALTSPTDKWVNTRSVWNQHTYHVTNVNLDGTLPFPETNSWAPGQSNSYRQNVQGQGVFSAPDLSACEVVPDLTNCLSGQATVSATVYNGGAIDARPGVPVDFFADLPGGAARIGTGTTKTMLKPGDSEKVTVPWPAPPQNTTVPVRAVVDPNQQVGDCHLENNTASSTPVRCSPIG